MHIEFSLAQKYASILIFPTKYTNSLVNPKRHGLFGQLDTWGGGNPPILEKCSVTPPNFIPKQQTVSHMKAEIFS